MRPSFYRPSPAMIVALIALFVALGGAGMAATGGNFILGEANSADQSTLLNVSTLPDAGTCPAPCNALKVTDTSTAANASGLGVLGKNPSLQAATIQNIGGGPALRLYADPGSSPLVVNSGAGKATNLDADLLDGLNSSAFQRTVTGTCGAGSAIGSIGGSGTVTCNKNSVRPGFTGGVSLAMNAHKCLLAQLNVAGTAVGDSGIVAPNARTWPAGLIFQVLRANQAGKLPIEVCNPTDAYVATGNQTVSIWIVKLVS
jgi:hypothetical protein